MGRASGSDGKWVGGGAAGFRGLTTSARGHGNAERSTDIYVVLNDEKRRGMS